MSVSAVQAGNRYTASFLRIGADARGLALAGAAVAQPGGPASFHWNPAAICGLTAPALQAMAATQFGSLRHPLGTFWHMGFGFPLRNEAFFAVNWVHFGVDDIPIYPELSGTGFLDRLNHAEYRPSGVALGYLNDSENALFFSVARKLRFLVDLGWLYLKVPVEIPLGVNFKIIRVAIGREHASGAGLDVGGMLRFDLRDLFPDMPLGRFSCGITVKDATATPVSWTTRLQESIRPAAIWGMAYMQNVRRWRSRFSFYCSSTDYRAGLSRFAFEWKYRDVFMLRVGSRESRLAVGAGLRFSRFQVDYALETHDLGPGHRISLRMNLVRRRK